MVRMIYCVMRREDVSLQDFRDFFNGEHRELVCRVARELKAKDYKQSLTLMVERNFTIMVRRGTEMPYDGVIELWWDNAADIEQAAESEDAQQIAKGFFDQASDFIDMKKSRVFFTEQPQSCF